VRPFRSPHHSASSVALVGGGSPPRPGEISLAHHGVLFLDELPEFDRHVLESLREPLESGTITISRAARQAEFPAKFQLVAAMNPCPCGHLTDPTGKCHCTLEQIARYKSKLSGPLLDRIDMHIEVANLPHYHIHEAPSSTEHSETVRLRVEQARALQMQRAKKPNALLGNREIEQHCLLQEKEKQLLAKIMEKLNLSARVYHRVLKLARTIADLDNAELISTKHLTEAIAYRRLDRGK
jgi:magnesium chelatase family protein